jgi:hypothetical protein
MFFKFSSNPLQQISRTVTYWIFIAGLMLIGFGVLCIAFPEVLAFVVAMLFFLAGISTISYAARIFWTIHKLGKPMNHKQDVYRKNVEIHGYDETNHL